MVCRNEKIARSLEKQLLAELSLEICYKGTPTLVFSCQYGETFKSKEQFFYRTPQGIASDVSINEVERLG